MTFKTTKLRDAITFALAAGATTLAGTGVAFAQETEGQEATTLDRIEVTGSRIKRVDIETSQPIFSLSREDIQAQGLTSVGDVIQNITANGSTLNTTMNNGGNGETRVTLRNLGSNRTLVLVNGRRWVGGTGLGGAVDLNTIPTAAVERIEVLKDGASVIYGSDAIAGVVNVILRDEFDGAEANAYIGQFDKGDGARQAYDFTVGTVSDRFSAMMGVGYVKEEPVLAGDRDISKEPVHGTGVAFGSSTTPNGRFALCPGDFDPVTGTCSVTQTRPDGTSGQFTYDPGQSGENWRNRTGSDIYNFAPDNYLLTPQERTSLFASGKLNITDNIRFKATATYNERVSEQLLAAMPIVLGSGPGASPNARAITISPDNIYNPFGQMVSRIQRRANETGFRSFNQDVDTFATNIGLEGDFDVGERFFSWEAGFFYGKNEQTQTTEGLFSLLALRDGLGPSFDRADNDLTNGIQDPVCGTPGNIILGCVPLNLLGAQGSLTPEMLDYASFTSIDQFEYKQKNYYANISGELFDLPAGPFAFAAGVEHREEDGFDQPDPLTAGGNSTGNNRAPTRGGYDLDEVFVELSIPILADVPGAQLLDVSLASRMSDYSNVGDTTNSKFGFRWKPIEDLMVRGNYTEGFRAPSVGELFTGVSDSFPTLTDPCAGSFDEIGTTAQNNCIADGVPDGGYDQGNPQIRISVGGNPDLQPETATTKTLGLVYSPSYVPGLDISLDWWNIKLENTITVFSGGFIVNSCIRSSQQFFCDLYDRAPGGAISTLLSAPLNIGTTEVEGYDLTVNYRLPEMDWGRLSFTWDTTYQSKLEEDIDGDGVITVGEGFNQVGEYSSQNNNWRIRSNLQARWELGDFGATWVSRYYSHQEEDCQNMVDYGYAFLCSDPDRIIDLPGDGNGDGDIVPGELAPTPAAQNRIGSVTYHDVSAYWNSPWNARVTLGINNLLDKDPPRSVQAFANSFDPQYEVPGRFYYLKYTQKF